MDIWDLVNHQHSECSAGRKCTVLVGVSVLLASHPLLLVVLYFVVIRYSGNVDGGESSAFAVFHCPQCVSS